MQFIDTHIHLQDFKADFALRVLENPQMKRLILVSAAMADFAKIGNWLKAYPDKLSGAFGIHPWHCHEDTDLLCEFLRRFPKALVGEIGVDGIKELPSLSQHILFSEQIKVAAKYNRPVIIHGARAFTALAEHERELKTVKFVYHGFVKNRELIKLINKCGGYFGLGAHFLKQEKATVMFRDMPQDKVLFETDAPYQVIEEGYNETVQENLYRLAEVSTMSATDLAAQLMQNSEDFLQC